MKLSVIILAPVGEAGDQSVRRVKDTVRFADEVIVRRCRQPIDDFALVRNSAMAEAKGEWVLFVDSDEEVTPQLAAEIQREIQAEGDGYLNSRTSGYAVNRRDRFLGQWLAHGETSRVRLVRLVRRGAGVWERPVHETCRVKGKVKELHYPLLHDSHQNIEGLLRKIDTYTTIERNFRRRPGSKMLGIQMTLFPLGKFIQNYFWRLGFLDGTAGFIHAAMMSFHSFLVRAKMIEITARDRDEIRISVETNTMKHLKLIAGLVFVIGWMTGQVTRLPGQFPLTLLDIGVVLLSGLALLDTRLDTRAPVGYPLSRILLVIAGSWLLALRLFPISQSVIGLAYLARIAAYGVVVGSASRLLKPVKTLIFPAMWVFLGLGILQYLVLPDTRFLLKFGWDEHYYRLIGTVLDPNYMGAMLGMMGIFGLYRYFLGRRRSDGIFCLVSFVALAVTFSRAAWLSTAGGLVVMLAHPLSRDSAWKAVLVILAIATMGWWIAPKPGGEGVDILRTVSITQRLESWRAGIEIWRDHQLVGVGFNNYSAARRTSGENHAANSPDSSWLLLLATTGLLGFGYVIYLMGYWIRGKGVLLRSIAILVGIHALFNNTIFFPPVLALMALIRASTSE